MYRGLCSCGLLPHPLHPRPEQTYAIPMLQVWGQGRQPSFRGVTPLFCQWDGNGSPCLLVSHFPSWKFYPISEQGQGQLGPSILSVPCLGHNFHSTSRDWVRDESPPNLVASKKAAIGWKQSWRSSSLSPWSRASVTLARGQEEGVGQCSHAVDADRSD